MLLASGKHGDVLVPTPEERERAEKERERTERERAEKEIERLRAELASLQATRKRRPIKKTST